MQATTRAWSWILTAPPPPSTTRSFHRYIGQCASDHQGVIMDTNCPPITTRSFHRYIGQCASDHQGVIMDANCPPPHLQPDPSTAIWVNVQATTRAWSGILTAPHLQPDPSTAIWVNVQATTRAWSGILTAPPSTTRSFHRYMGQCASDHQGVIMDTNCPPIYNQILPPLYGSMCKRPPGRDHGY